MKVVTRQLVPAEEVEITTYRCDVPGCDYDAEDEDYVREHFGKEHTVRATKQIEVGGDTFDLYWFEFEEHPEMWVTAVYDEFYTTRATWDGPGWYYTNHTTEPCRRGCCQDNIVEVESLKSLVAYYRNQAARFLNNAQELQAALDKLEDPCCDND